MDHLWDLMAIGDPSWLFLTHKITSLYVYLCVCLCQLLLKSPLFYISSVVLHDFMYLLNLSYFHTAIISQFFGNTFFHVWPIVPIVECDPWDHILIITSIKKSISFWFLLTNTKTVKIIFPNKTYWPLLLCQKLARLFPQDFIINKPYTVSTHRSGTVFLQPHPPYHNILRPLCRLSSVWVNHTVMFSCL